MASVLNAGNLLRGMFRSNCAEISLRRCAYLSSISRRRGSSDSR